MEKIKKIKFFLSTWYGVATIASLFLFGINAKFFWVYFTSPVIQGWDGAGHFAATVEYSKHIFPSVWGWFTNWYGGMPFPQYYPPLMSFLLALLYKILFFLSPITVFKLFVGLLQLGLVYTFVFVAKEYTKKLLSWYVSALVAVILLCSSASSITSIGITVIATFQTAMIAQLLSGILFLLFIVFLERAFTSVKYIPHASIFFAGVVLSNAHSIIPVGLYFIGASCVALYKHTNKKVFVWRSIMIGALAVGITACWAFPLLRYYMYLDTYPNFNQSGTLDILKFGAIPFFIILGLIVGIWKKNRLLVWISLFMTCIVLAPAGISLLSRFGVVAHIQRWIGLLLLCIPFIAAITFEEISAYLKKFLFRILLAVIFLGVCFYSATSWSYNDFQGMYTKYTLDAVPQVTSYLKDHPRNGFLDVEVDTNASEPTSFVLSSMYGLVTPGDVFILRESSPSAQFLTPVRNSFSLIKEAWGFETYLSFNNKFTQQPITQSLDRAERLGITSFLVRSQWARKRLAGDPRIVLEKDFGKWALYSFVKETPRAYIPQYQPIAFYGPVSFKYRSIADYDWGKVQEALLFYNLPYITFLPQDQYLDSSPELQKSGAAYISSYLCHDCARAESAIVSYAKTHEVILVESDEPLFAHLQKDARADSTLHIQILVRAPRVPTDQERSNLVFLQFNDSVLPQIGNAFSHINVPKVDSKVHVGGVSFAYKSTDIVLDGIPTTEVPVLITQSYFPAWKQDKGSLYMASPSYTLLFSKDKNINLIFTTPLSVYLGWIVTLGSLLVLGLLLNHKSSNKDQ